MAESAAGLLDVAVCFQFGQKSKPKTTEIYEKAKEAILKAVPHAEVTCDNSLIDYGKLATPPFDALHSYFFF